MKAHYQRGGLGDTTIKQILFEVIEAFLTPIREEREKIRHEEILDILIQGSVKAREIAAVTLSEVREAMGLCYF